MANPDVLVRASSGRTFSSLNPATGAVAGEVPDCDAADVAGAVDAASTAFESWRRMPAAARGRLIRSIGELTLQHAAELAALITAEQGKPLGEARFEVMLAAEALFWFAEEGRRTYGQTIPDPMPNRRLYTMKQPVGVVAAVTPWNIPLLALPRKVAAALAAGCTVVLKPAEQSPLVAQAFAELVLEAGVPAGVVNVITTRDPAPVVEALLGDRRVRKLSFTGSTAVGKLLLAGAAATVKNVTLELGGNAPAIIFADANVRAAVTDLVRLKTQIAGQNCLAPNRFYVHESVVSEVSGYLVEQVDELRVGDGADASTQMGPLIDRDAVEKVERHIADAVSRGARVLTGGSRYTDGSRAAGYFFPPTVLTDVPRTALAVNEETFGPVYSIVPFADEDDVVADSNRTEQGLAAYVFTQDLSRAMRVVEVLDCGMVAVNENRIASTETPFGGTKASGLGRESGQAGVDAYLETKTVAVRFDDATR